MGDFLNHTTPNRNNSMKLFLTKKLFYFFIIKCLKMIINLPSGVKSLTSASTGVPRDIRDNSSRRISTKYFYQWKLMIIRWTWRFPEKCIVTVPVGIIFRVLVFYFRLVYIGFRIAPRGLGTFRESTKDHLYPITSKRA